MANAMRAWNPDLHPRDNRGRFGRKHSKTTDADKAAGNEALSGFKPTKIASNQAAETYLRDRAPKLSPHERAAVSWYTGDGFYDMNKRMRAGDVGDSNITRLDAAMRPTDEDLIVTRHVEFSAFGLTNKTRKGVEDLAGRTVIDKAYSSTALGTPYGGGLGGVTMHIAVPKGTRAIPTSALSRNPHERELLLDRDLPLAISRVVPNNRGGYDVYAVVLPKEEAE